MKSRTFMALAVAGTFACGSAFAGGVHHGAQHSSSHSTSIEVQTPSSVNESAPWLANQPHSAGWATQQPSTAMGMQEGQFSDGPVGTSSSIGGSGSAGFDSMSSTGFDSSMSGIGFDVSSLGGVEYWLLGDDSYGTGTTSSLSGSGSGGFDSMSSLNSDDSFGMTEYYLVSGPLAQFDGDEYILFESGASADDIALLGALTEDFYVLTPIYDDMADASSFGASQDQLSQYSPLSGDEDLAT
jgi:hypothetical protein